MICQGVRLAKIERVSCRLLARSRDISSSMLTDASRRDVAELLDLGFELGDRLFEIEETDGHRSSAAAASAAAAKVTGPAPAPHGDGGTPRADFQAEAADVDPAGSP